MVPISAAEKLRQTFTCADSGCRYSSLGAAFLCPACGHNSAAATYSHTIEAVRETLAALPGIRDAVQALSGRDAAANTIRQILEKAWFGLLGHFNVVQKGFSIV